MKIALVQDWLIHLRGGEKVLEALAEIYPEATIYTLFCRKSRLEGKLLEMEIKTSFLQWIPGICRFYRWLLPLLPWVIRTLRIDPETRLVISSSHCVAKGIRIPPGARHLCYCHTPMRYLWGYEKDYFGNWPGLLRALVMPVLERLRGWDKRVNLSVDTFVANSENVRSRIQRYYGRDAAVIYPPLNAGFYQPGGPKQGYYLVVSAFVPYKRVDLVIKAFNELERKLLIVGSGPLESFYRKLRRSEHIHFLGSLQPLKLREIYAGARALIFPTDEDFGIVPLEAQACGTPVIAYGKGGALESVKSGVFFDAQTPEALRQAVVKFESMDFEEGPIAAKVKSFDRENFKQEIRKITDAMTAAGQTHVTG